MVSFKKMFLCLFLFLAVLNVLADATVEIMAVCSDDVLLSCKGIQDPQVTYSAVFWYKVGI